MLFDLIEKLRQKSVRQKKRIAFLGAFSFTGLIFVVWLSVIFPNFVEKEKREKQALAAQPTPSSAVGENIKSGLSELMSQISGLKTYMNSVVSGTDHFTATSTPASQSANVYSSQNLGSTTVSTTTEE